MRKTPSYTLNDGFRMPMGFATEAFASALGYQARPGDLFVATYPKCGTTWVQHIVYLLLHDGTPLRADQSMTREFPHLEEVGGAAVEALPPPRCIKTHLPFSMTPYHAAARYIYVARNPFDCVVSFYHHTRGFPKHYDFAEGTFDAYFECFIAGEVDFGDYFDNLISWQAHEGEENILFLTYEQMTADPRSAVSRIADFLQVRLRRGDATLGDILRHSSFRSMSEHQGRWSSKRPQGMPAFVRKGVVGDWMNHLSGVQARRLARRFAERSTGTQLESLWPEILAAARDAD